MSHRLDNEQGFTLIELLVVILIIGILAAIALPNFVSQRDRAYDATAKADVRNTMTHVEACFSKSEDYRQCQTLTELGGPGLGIPLGSAKGEVSVAAGSADGYILTAHSKTDGLYSIEKTSGTWQVERTCTVAPGKSDSGCKDGKW